MGELSRALTEQELTEWIAYYNMEPFGEYRADLRSAQICQILANAHRDSSKKPTPFTIRDFMLFNRAVVTKKQSADEIRNVMMALVRQGERKKKEQK